MPAVSKKQRKFFGMLEHNPGMAKKKGINMTKSQMHDFAATKEKGLPTKKGKDKMTPKKSAKMLKKISKNYSK